MLVRTEVPLWQSPMDRSSPDFEGTGSANDRGQARLTPSTPQNQSHENTRDQARYQALLTEVARPTTQTDSSLLPIRQGHPCRSCAYEDLWSKGTRHGSTLPACVVGVCLRSCARAFVLYWPEGGLFFVWMCHHKKQCQISF